MNRTTNEAGRQAGRQAGSVLLLLVGTVASTISNTVMTMSHLRSQCNIWGEYHHGMGRSKTNKRKKKLSKNKTISTKDH